MRRFWRWLTCGHGRHARWKLHAAFELGRDADPTWDIFVVRHCPRCDTTEVLE